MSIYFDELKQSLLNKVKYDEAFCRSCLGVEPLTATASHALQNVGESMRGADSAYLRAKAVLIRDISVAFTDTVDLSFDDLAPIYDLFRRYHAIVDVFIECMCSQTPHGSARLFMFLQNNAMCEVLNQLIGYANATQTKHMLELLCTPFPAGSSSGSAISMDQLIDFADKQLAPSHLKGEILRRIIQNLQNLPEATHRQSILEDLARRVLSVKNIIAADQYYLTFIDFLLRQIPTKSNQLIMEVLEEVLEPMDGINALDLICQNTNGCACLNLLLELLSDDMKSTFLERLLRKLLIADRKGVIPAQSLICDANKVKVLRKFLTHFALPNNEEIRNALRAIVERPFLVQMQSVAVSLLPCESDELTEVMQREGGIYVVQTCLNNLPDFPSDIEMTALLKILLLPYSNGATLLDTYLLPNERYATLLSRLLIFASTQNAGVARELTGRGIKMPSNREGSDSPVFDELGSMGNAEMGQVGCIAALTDTICSQAYGVENAHMYDESVEKKFEFEATGSIDLDQALFEAERPPRPKLLNVRKVFRCIKQNLRQQGLPLQDDARMQFYSVISKMLKHIFHNIREDEQSSKYFTQLDGIAAQSADCWSQQFQMLACQVSGLDVKKSDKVGRCEFFIALVLMRGNILVNFASGQTVKKRFNETEARNYFSNFAITFFPMYGVPYMLPKGEKLVPVTEIEFSEAEIAEVNAAFLAEYNADTIIKKAREWLQDDLTRLEYVRNAQPQASTNPILDAFGASSARITDDAGMPTSSAIIHWLTTLGILRAKAAS